MADSDSSSNPNPNYRTYNPYQDIHINPGSLKVFRLPTTPEHLFEEERHRTRRSWGENLTFYTGAAYATGAALGAAKGTVQGLSAAEYGDSLKIRVSRVLNAGGHAGRRLGNSAGTLAVIYSGLDALISYQLGSDDMLGSVLAGLGTGALYRVASGVRSAAIAGALGGIAAGALVSGRHVLKRYVPI